MADCIIRISLKRYLRIMYLHSSVKHIAQEQIGENKNYDSPLGYKPCQLCRRLSFVAHYLLVSLQTAQKWFVINGITSPNIFPFKP